MLDLPQPFCRAHDPRRGFADFADKGSAGVTSHRFDDARTRYPPNRSFLSHDATNAAICEFVAAERDRERQNGTVPVEVWNRLEDATTRLEDAVSGYVEPFLSASYATGEYYAGSDIDLILAHDADAAIDNVLDEVMGNIGDDRLQILAGSLDGIVDHAGDDKVLDQVYQRSPIGNGEMLIPLTGEVGEITH